ncbi:MAG: response regulator [Magnetovibrio sp.]|nr:response regulator [Magnetovibrio sp.]
MLGISEQAAKFCVLCLDTDREWLAILKRELKTMGFREVLTTPDPKKALGMMQIEKPDVVITNHNLKFVQFLRSSDSSPNREVPVVMVTNRVGPDDIFAIRDAGVNEIAVKPCSIAQLVQRVEAIVTHPRRFIWSDNFKGPDRRRKGAEFNGPERRVADE